MVVEEAGSVEKELTIFSAVRSSSKQAADLDILSDPRVLNTVLTRGRRGLVIFGDCVTLAQDENWKELLIWANSLGMLLQTQA